MIVTRPIDSAHVAMELRQLIDELEQDCDANSQLLAQLRLLLTPSVPPWQRYLTLSVLRRAAALADGL